MAKVGPLRVKMVVDPGFIAAIEKATAAVEELGVLLKRDDLLTVETDLKVEE